MLAGLIVAVDAVSRAGAAVVIAPMVSVVVQKNSEVLISLPGYSDTGVKVSSVRLAAPKSPPLHRRVVFASVEALIAFLCRRVPPQLTTKITSLPAVGTLYQISQIFSDYGYEPKRGLAITSAAPSSPVTITGSRNRFVYTPPANTNEPQNAVRAWRQRHALSPFLACLWLGCGTCSLDAAVGRAPALPAPQLSLSLRFQKARVVPLLITAVGVALQWATFTYTVSDGSTTSAPGIVWLVPPHGNTVYSDFSTSLDGWSVVGNGARASLQPAGGLTYEPFSRGVLNHYVLATEAEINTNKYNGNDDSLWYFVAPSKFLGMQNIAYGGTFSFAMSSAAGTRL